MEDCIKKILSSSGKPLTLLQISKRAGYGKKGMKKIKKVLKIMEQKGEVLRKGKKYLLAEVKTGVFKRYKGGFGFVLQEEEEDIYIPRKEAKKVQTGDIVKVVITGKKRKPEGKIVDIVKKSEKKLTGTWINNKIVPDDPHLPVFLIKKKTNIPQKVVFSARKKIKIEKILGKEDDPKVDVEVIIARYGFSKEFPQPVIWESQIKKKIPKVSRDLTQEIVFTIDPKNAKDFDDAISIERTKKGFILGVHIADVSYWVGEKSATDKEARNRGTSVYLLDTVIPMLPHAISSDKGSLQPGKRRLAFSVVMYFNKKGEMLSKEFFPSLIHSKARLTYEDAMRIIENIPLEDSETQIKVDLKKLRDKLKIAEELCDILWEQRKKRGGLDFDLPEPFFVFMPGGKIQDIYPSLRLKTHRMIEEFMISANRAVAECMVKHDVPCIFRVHEPPQKSKIEELEKLTESILGEKIEIKHQKDINLLLEKAKEKKREKLISYLVLRSLAKAKYQVENTGHFGLALEEYLHFTSPIRRYPDLVVHRILKDVLKNKIKRDKEWIKYLEETASIASEREEIAEEAEWELWDLKKAEFMQNKLGEIFEGIVTDIIGAGIFVTVEEHLVEGFIPIEAFKKVLFYSPEKIALVDRRNKEFLKIGDRIKVQVAFVNKWQKRIDFVPVNK